MQIQSALSLILFAGTASAQALEGPVTILFKSDRPLPTGVLNAMQREADAAVFPSLIRLAWQSQNAAEAPSVHYRLAVLNFRGECRVGAPLPPGSGSTNVDALGQTQSVNGEVLPISDIQCDATRQYLDRELRGLTVPEQDEALGRALGRVVAHELYHILLRTRAHAKTGLGRPMLSRAELLSARHTFAAAEQRRLAEAAGSEEEGDSR